MGQVILGDCLPELKKLPVNSVDLVYLDPPFFTQKTHSLKSKNLRVYKFEDTWNSLPEYIEFLALRLKEMKRVMKDNATIFFHCDKTASHHIRLLLDEIFRMDNFLSEIIWSYKRWSNSKRNLLSSHQTIYMYSKSSNYTFNVLMQDYSRTTNLDQILQMRVRDENGKTVYARTENGDVQLNGPKQGVPLTDTWEIPYLNPKAKERTGYPTQKPILLLERIIKIASHPSDIILDPFCGSGTTLVAAKLLNRNYIGIDISKDAIELSKNRLEHPIKSESQVLNKGREAYDNLPDYVKNIITSIHAKVIQRNSGIDAIYDEYLNDKPIVIRVQRYDEALIDAANKLSASGKRKNAELKILIQTVDDGIQLHFDMMMPKDVIVLSSLEKNLQQSIRQYHENL